MLNLIIHGPPGCGKGTQSAKIVKNYNLEHLSTGRIFRREIRNKTAIGELMKKFVDRGLLVPDAIVLRELYREAIYHIYSNGLVFDGFPRTFQQAEVFDKMLLKKKIRISLMISIEVEEHELVRRILNRKNTSGRSDDTLEVLKNRLDVYQKQTLAVIGYYKKRGKFVSVDGMADVDKVFEKICHEIENIR